MNEVPVFLKSYSRYLGGVSDYDIFLKPVDSFNSYRTSKKRGIEFLKLIKNTTNITVKQQMLIYSINMGRANILKKKMGIILHIIKKSNNKKRNIRVCRSLYNLFVRYKDVLFFSSSVFKFHLNNKLNMFENENRFNSNKYRRLLGTNPICIFSDNRKNICKQICCIDSEYCFSHTSYIVSSVKNLEFLPSDISNIISKYAF